MARNKKSLFAAAAAFAASPQGRRMLQQAKEYASRPENRARAKQFIADARSRRKGTGSPPPFSSGRTGDQTPPVYGTPPQH